MTKSFFVTRLDHANHLINQMPLSYARSSLYCICGILLLLTAVSFFLGSRSADRTSTGGTLFSPDSTMLLKGLAIILLLVGHVSQQCVVGSEALPFRATGNAAVIIFLFVSGVGLAKSYHLQADRLFWPKRLKKIAMPVWLSLIFIIPLNFLLIGHLDPAFQSVLNFCGVFWTKFPDSPCWFITYILFLYADYFIVSLLPAGRAVKLAILFLLPFAASWLIVKTGSIDHFILWPQYSLVFPAGVACGLNASRLKAWNDKLLSFSPAAFIVCLLIPLVLYGTGFAVYRISHLVSSDIFTQLVFALINPLPLLLFLVFFVGLLETYRLDSAILKFLGRHSFEMYLLHFPFMVYYDFFLFRRPLVVFFFIYSFWILLLSIVLQRAAAYLDVFIFRKGCRVAS